MFNLPNLNEQTLIPWLLEFESQTSEKLSNLNKKINKINVDNLKLDIGKLQRDIKDLPIVITNALFPVGTVVANLYDDQSETLAEIYGGTWVKMNFTGTGVYFYGRTA